MKILIIGHGGREHALAWKLSQSPQVNQIFIAPGNEGTSCGPMLTNLPIASTTYDIHTLKTLANFAEKENISFTVVGPEAPLASGIVDIFRSRKLKIFGPTQKAAQLESSKAFAKTFMHRHNILTAPYMCFSTVIAAEKYLKQCEFPVVIKIDGLANGKGVFISPNIADAQKIIKKIFTIRKNSTVDENQKTSIIIEKFLKGEEASFIVMTDGFNILPLASSQDHKRLYNNDQGPNTGGMGAYSPAPIINNKMHCRIMKEIIKPTIDGMAKDGIPYSGFLYAGIMITPDQNIYTLEFNCRLGDPETQVIMPRLKGDFAHTINLALNNKLDQETLITWDPRYALGVVMASSGYPSNVEIGTEIIFNRNNQGLINKKNMSCKENDTFIFHNATKRIGDKILTNGGRVLSIVSMGDSIHLAQKKAYTALKEIYFHGAQYRDDIGYRAIKN